MARPRRCRKICTEPAYDSFKPEGISVGEEITMTVDAFRSVICAGESIRTPVIVMCVITILFTILTIIEFQFRTRRIKAGKPIFHDFLEEKGLA